MRLYHRGAYEHLWAEQRYAVMAVAWKAYLSMSRRFNPKTPHILTFLRQLAYFSSQPQIERANALMNAYNHVKPGLSRECRRSLVEGILADSSVFPDEIYRYVLDQRETFLYGCRLFFPSRAFYKFWDFEDGAGLWICLGPFLALASPVAVRRRLQAWGKMNEADLIKILEDLKRGMPRGEYDSLPSAWREALDRHCAVAVLANTAFLHPRFPHPLPETDTEPRGMESAALFALEACWDKKPDLVPLLPAFEEWRDEWVPEKVPEKIPFGSFDREADPMLVWKKMEESFLQQQNLEPRPRGDGLDLPDEDAREEEPTPDYADDL